MEFQLEILRWIQGHHQPFLDSFFTLITMTAEEPFFILIAAWLLWCGNKEVGYRIGFAFLSSTVINPLLKNTFRIERPIGREGIEAMRLHTATGYAFPSGHSQGGASFWTGLMSSYRRRWLYAAGTVMIVLVGFSRLYLGVHWLTDVVGGIVIGVLWVLLVNLLYDFTRRQNNPFILLLVVLPLAVGHVFYPDKAYIVSMGSLFGFWLGFVIETRYIKYDQRARPPVQIGKLLSGLIVIVLLKEGLKPLLPFTPQIADLLRYFCIGLWITAGAPWLFLRIFPRPLPKKE